MMNWDELMEMGRQMEASDVHISEGLPVMFRIRGDLQPAPVLFTDREVLKLVEEVLSVRQMDAVKNGEDLDFSHQAPDGSRQRVNIYRQQGKIAVTVRLLNNSIPRLEQLGLPPVLQKMAELPRGLVLVTGPTGSGKSTTLAAMVEHVNLTRPEHIITIEDPIEYVYESKRALIHQRETGQDVKDFASALRSALREDPDVILVGEMRDYETISAALTAAETGHLVLSTLHTTGAARTVDRIIDACPDGSKNQIRTQLSGALQGVISQCLIPTADGRGRVAATEILVGNDAVHNTIRENKAHQLSSMMQAGGREGMHTLNMDLSRLVYAGTITKEMAFRYTNDAKDLENYIS